MVQVQETPTTRSTKEALGFNELNVLNLPWRNALPSSGTRSSIWSFLSILCSRRPAHISGGVVRGLSTNHLGLGVGDDEERLRVVFDPSRVEWMTCPSSGLIELPS